MQVWGALVMVSSVAGDIKNVTGEHQMGVHKTLHTAGAPALPSALCEWQKIKRLRRLAEKHRNRFIESRKNKSGLNLEKKQQVELRGLFR
ncbi:hypothetical protein NDU88_001460 [Pleurodeles waltl]|uniref:Uncharacterized protein n=1 Tax=Pleurodeles waltl TaxID=8319 RepID=A0AAV7KR11_PLEWA|nr:hypothetical protein NDU88_001460 [Pleurodeles waltl]